MARYLKCSETRRSILDTATVLFWEKGYEDTRYEDLAQNADINPGSIHYYFKSKAGLAQAVYDNITKAIFHEVEKIIDIRSGVLLYDFVCTFATWQWYSSNFNLCRFCYEIAQKKIHFVRGGDSDIYIYQKLNEEYNLGMSEYKIAMYNRLSCVVGAELLLAYVEDDNKLSPAEYAKYEIAYSFNFPGIPQQEIEDTIMRAESIVNQYEFFCTDNFEFFFKKRSL